MPGNGVVERLGRLGRVEVVGGDEVGVVAREAPQRLDGAGAGVEQDDAAVAVAEGVLGHLLEVGPQRRDDVAGVDLVVEQVPQTLQLEPRRGAAERGVLGPLELGRAEREREVAADVGEQLAGRVAALVAVAVARRDALGHDRTVGRDDRAAGPGEVAHDGPVVAGVGVVPVGPHHLHHVELDEQGDEQHHQADRRGCGSGGSRRPSHRAGPCRVGLGLRRPWPRPCPPGARLAAAAT